MKTTRRVCVSTPQTVRLASREIPAFVRWITGKIRPSEIRSGVAALHAHVHIAPRSRSISVRFRFHDLDGSHRPSQKNVRACGPLTLDFLQIRRTQGES
jgi:hypothetical protein